LAGAFAAVFVALAWEPYDRGDWLLENLISAPVAVGLVLGRRRLPFTTASWILVFCFLALHEIGSHYTYSRVPWMEWSRELLGWAPPWQRNHYDRLLHLGFGLLLTRPMAELLAGPLAGRPLLRRLLPVCCIMTLSALYELLEWAAALVVDPQLGIAFVGAQGDIWDAQKDMALALGGSGLATAVAWIRESAS
jgi:putative membrane protein